MQANPGRDTKPELRLRRALHARGHRYFVNYPPVPGLRRTADLVFPGARLAVFVDGCYWHSCPEHATTAKANAEFWREKLARNRDRDQETNELLAAAAWRVVRIWEHVPTRDAVSLVEAALASDEAAD